MEMELRDIEYFAVIAERGHLGRAAEALGLSQPALSKSLRRLEQSMQTKLVRRTPKGVELTTEGSALLAHVQQLRLSLGDVVREIADLGQGRAGHLRIGAGTGFVEYLLPAACGALSKDAPKVTLAVTALGNAALLSALRHGELDLIVSGIPAAPYEDLVQEHLCDDDYVVYASANHRLAKRKRVTIADLAQERWALSAINDLSWQWVHRAFEKSGLAPPRITMLASSTAFRFNTVASCELVGFNSRRLLQQTASRLHCSDLKVKELTWNRRIGVSYRKNAYLSPAALRLIEILKTTAREIAKEP
jgi:DNA-binding transcriptional LysR family regulator